MSLPFSTLARIAWRSLFIQAGFSPEAMQSLGLLYVLAPAWPRLFPDEARRQEAVQRHLSPFNTHPYAAAAMVGGILFHEERLARGEGTAEDVERFKQTFMGPLAALGDGFFWLSLRPAMGALAVALTPWLGAWSVVLFLATYNAVHFVTRLWLFSTGYRYGGGAVVMKLSAWKVPLWSNRLRAVAVAAAAVSALWFADALAVVGGQARALGAGSLVLGAASWWLLQRKVSPVWLLYGAALVATVVGALW
ncbi:MAG: PTS system mannose/fructose/sorbose family transporter subunit IID [Myxococcaceae bacterium]